LEIVRPLADSRQLVIQHGHTTPLSSLTATWREFVPYDEMLTLIGEAEGVISHAGVGMILSTLAAGKVPVVLPRLKRLGEHVDDHQLQIVTAFEKRGFVVCCDSSDNVVSMLERASRTSKTVAEQDQRLRHAVGAATRRGR
jgi:UDP-N-acetylglucosamine transferase subunit ALG13